MYDELISCLHRAMSIGITEAFEEGGDEALLSDALKRIENLIEDLEYFEKAHLGLIKITSN